MIRPRHLLISGLSSAAVLFGADSVWHWVFFPNTFETLNYIGRPEVLMQALLIGEAIRAFFMVRLFPHTYKGHSPVMEGLRFGALFSLTLGGVWIFWSYALFPIMSLVHYFFLEGLGLVFSGALGGVVIGYFHDRFEG